MLVMKLNKALNTGECIEYSKMISGYLGETVIILDKYADSIYRLEEEKKVIENHDILKFEEKFVSFLINEGDTTKKISIDEMLEYEKAGYQIEIKMSNGKDVKELAIEITDDLGEK